MKYNKLNIWSEVKSTMLIYSLNIFLKISYEFLHQLISQELKKLFNCRKYAKSSDIRWTCYYGADNYSIIYVSCYIYRWVVYQDKLAIPIGVRTELSLKTENVCGRIIDQNQIKWSVYSFTDLPHNNIHKLCNSQNINISITIFNDCNDSRTFTKITKPPKMTNKYYQYVSAENYLCSKINLRANRQYMNSINIFNNVMILNSVCFATTVYGSAFPVVRIIHSIGKHIQTDVSGQEKMSAQEVSEITPSLSELTREQYQIIKQKRIDDVSASNDDEKNGRRDVIANYRIDEIMAEEFHEMICTTVEFESKVLKYSIEAQCSSKKVIVCALCKILMKYLERYITWFQNPNIQSLRKWDNCYRKSSRSRQVVGSKRKTTLTIYIKGKSLSDTIVAVHLIFLVW
ncbi:hypothetical protein QTP88_019047 [Uroleucon formosanum]